MYKKIVIMVALGLVMTIKTITLDQNILKNSSMDYLVDLAGFINDPMVTKQVGQELYSRAYSDHVTTYAEHPGRFNAKPITPPEGHTPQGGQWVWVASAGSQQQGTWFWILRTRSAYVELFNKNRSLE